MNDHIQTGKTIHHFMYFLHTSNDVLLFLQMEMKVKVKLEITSFEQDDRLFSFLCAILVFKLPSLANHIMLKH